MPHQTISRLLRWIALLALALFVLFFALHSWNVLFFPYQVEYGEGPVLDWARQLAQGELPYKAIEPFPWSFSVYTPGYLAASGLLIALFPDAPWFGGRLLSLISGLLLAGLLLLTQRPIQRSSETLRPPQIGSSEQKRSWSFVPFGAWLTAFLWLASPYLFRWATFYRPDLFALFWSALGIVLVQRAVMRQRLGWLSVAACCFVLSFCSKQSFFAAPLASMIYLWLVWRAGLWRLVWAGALGGGVVAIGLWLMTGSALFDNLIAANANPFSWQALWRFEASFFSIIPIIALLALWAMVNQQRLEGSSKPNPEPRTPNPVTLLTLYAMLSLLVTISVGKAGAWENYFLEPLWVLCALAGVTMSEWLSPRFGAGSHDWRSLSLSKGAVPLLVLLQLGFFLRGFERLSPAAELAWLSELHEENAALHTTLDSLPAEALVWSEQMGVLAESGRAVPLHSFVYTQLEHQGLWDVSPLIEQLATGKAPLLIQQHNVVVDPLRNDRWSRLMLDASERGYTIGQLAGRWRMRSPLPFVAQDGAGRHAHEVIALESGIEVVNWMAMTVEMEKEGQILPAPVELPAGQSLKVHLLWRTPEREPAALSASVQLFGPNGERVVQDDAPLRGGLGGTWAAGALVRDEHTLELPDELAAGGYTLQVSLYESETGSSRGMIALPRFKVRPPSPSGSLAVSREISFANLGMPARSTLHLLSHDSLPSASDLASVTPLAAGDTLTLRVRWRAEQATSQHLTAFLHLIAPDGSLAAQSDFQPPYPPYLWSLGEKVEVTYSLQLPDTLLPGNYELRVGWYDAVTFERLPAQGEETVDGALRLEEVTVK